ncbi:MAG: ABC transporter substrate-binding protein [Alphaproteobacteria bacterium]|nr:ABC transporter substrate-binding protein [Alphaproteobacteria bacterium]
MIVIALVGIASVLYFGFGSGSGNPDNAKVADSHCAPVAAEKGEAWAEISAKACDTVVKFHAWGGGDTINDYIAWAGKQTNDTYNVAVEHVKISNTADSVQLVVADKAAGNDSDGAIDLIWINGENFRTLKQAGLLYGPFTQNLPNFDNVDIIGKPTTILDFTVPTDGYESPWGMAQLVFFYDSARTDMLPEKMQDFLEVASAQPGRFSYPAPPDFLGVTFLKQALVELVADKDILAKPPATDAVEITAPLWTFLDALHPNLWQNGRNFPKDWPAQSQLLADGELYYAFAFNPNGASSGIARGELPDTIRSFVLDDGTIGNTHFLAIPYNAANPEGAMIVADFMLSIEAQSRKANPDIWGDPTVLDVTALDDEGQAKFDALPIGVATLSAEELGTVLPEPHPAWSEYLKTEWQKRYGQ